MESTFKQLVLENLSRKEDITTDELMQLNSFKNIGDDKAKELLKLIKGFTEIVFCVAVKQEREALVMTMHLEQARNAAA